MKKEDVLTALEIQEPFQNGLTYEEGIGKKIANIEQDGYSYSDVHTEKVCLMPRKVAGAYGFYDENNRDVPTDD